MEEDAVESRHRMRSDKIVIYWEREYSTAFPPERLKLDFYPHRPMISHMTLDEQRDTGCELDTKCCRMTAGRSAPWVIMGGSFVVQSM